MTNQQLYVHSPNGMYTINDLACNNITIETICEGSAQIITEPPGATIFIDDVRQQIGGMDIPTPARIDSIPCTDPINKPNKFKLTLPGYRDEEGILYITSSNTPLNPYPLNITMEIAPNEMGGLLIAALAIGTFMFFLSRDKEKK